MTDAALSLPRDMIDAQAFSIGIKVVQSDLIGPGQAFLFRDPMPMKFEIPKPVFEPSRDLTRIGMYACFSMPSPHGIIMGCDFCGPEPKRRKWHWRYRGPRRRSRRCLSSNLKITGPMPKGNT